MCEGIQGIVELVTLFHNLTMVQLLRSKMLKCVFGIPPSITCVPWL
jgi:hypothetical protein